MDKHKIDGKMACELALLSIGELPPLIEQIFGKRCREYEPECYCCRVWRAYDVLSEEFEVAAE